MEGLRRGQWLALRGLSFLSQGQREEAHLLALEILEKAGVKVIHDEALALLKREGLWLKITILRSTKNSLKRPTL